MSLTGRPSLACWKTKKRKGRTKKRRSRCLARLSRKIWIRARLVKKPTATCGTFPLFCGGGKSRTRALLLPAGFTDLRRQVVHRLAGQLQDILIYLLKFLFSVGIHIDRGAEMGAEFAHIILVGQQMLLQ